MSFCSVCRVVVAGEPSLAEPDSGLLLAAPNSTSALARGPLDHVRACVVTVYRSAHQMDWRPRALSNWATVERLPLTARYIRHLRLLRRLHRGPYRLLRSWALPVYIYPACWKAVHTSRLVQFEEIFRFAVAEIFSTWGSKAGRQPRMLALRAVSHSFTARIDAGGTCGSISVYAFGLACVAWLRWRESAPLDPNRFSARLRLVCRYFRDALSKSIFRLQK